MGSKFDLLDESIDQRVLEAWQFIVLLDVTLNTFLGGSNTSGPGNDESDQNGRLFRADTVDPKGGFTYPYGVLAVGLAASEERVGFIFTDVNLRMDFYVQADHRVMRPGERDVSALRVHIQRLFYAKPNHLLCSDLFLEIDGSQRSMVTRTKDFAPVELSETADGVAIHLGLSLTWESRDDDWLNPPPPEDIPYGPFPS